MYHLKELKVEKDRKFMRTYRCYFLSVYDCWQC